MRFRSLLSQFPAKAFLTTLATVAILLPNPAQASGEVWEALQGEASAQPADPWIEASAYRAFRLDWGPLEGVLARAPEEGRTAADGGDVVLRLPLPDGRFESFSIENSPIMEEGLARKFPQLRTFRGLGLDDPSALVRFDVTPHGFHAMILRAGETVFIDPWEQGDRQRYISYFKSAAVPRPGNTFTCGFEAGELGEPLGSRDRGESPRVPSGTNLRTYRLALAATGEYTAFHGGTVGDGMAAIVTAMNRVNGIYERDVAIRMTLIANNDLVVYTNGGTDPYSNNSGGAMLGQNQTNLDNVIGSANYDIGHVFSTGGGGVANLGVPCRAGAKARGVTGLSSPVGDPFYVDFVAHEMGHQWGGTHTFNGTTGSCSGGNRTGSTAYEPGSGTTIMAYAGICGSQDIQNNSDDDFHIASIDQIVAYSTAGSGNGCPVTTATGNTIPTVDAGANFTVPANTPFELCGTASDPDAGALLTYDWEEFDLGPAGAPNSPVGDAPIFRSFVSTTNPCRTFPRSQDLLNNTQTLGELLPAVSRTMTFRLTARDNQPGGGGVDHDSMSLSVAGGAGPFLVTAPNTALSWPGASSQTVSWDTAGTAAAPVSCAMVDILLSSDGGLTFPQTLLAGTANDGTEIVTVPNGPIAAARIRVQCTGNVFFDVSDANFEITFSGDPIFSDGFESGDTSAWSATSP